MAEYQKIKSAAKVVGVLTAGVAIGHVGTRMTLNNNPLSLMSFNVKELKDPSSSLYMGSPIERVAEAAYTIEDERNLAEPRHHVSGVVLALYTDSYPFTGFTNKRTIETNLYLLVQGDDNEMYQVGVRDGKVWGVKGLPTPERFSELLQVDYRLKHHSPESFSDHAENFWGQLKGNKEFCGCYHPAFEATTSNIAQKESVATFAKQLHVGSKVVFPTIRERAIKAALEEKDQTTVTKSKNTGSVFAVIATPAEVSTISDQFPVLLTPSQQKSVALWNQMSELKIKLRNMTNPASGKVELINGKYPTFEMQQEVREEISTLSKQIFSPKKDLPGFEDLLKRRLLVKSTAI